MDTFFGFSRPHRSIVWKGWDRDLALKPRVWSIVEIIKVLFFSLSFTFEWVQTTGLFSFHPELNARSNPKVQNFKSEMIVSNNKHSYWHPNCGHCISSASLEMPLEMVVICPQQFSVQLLYCFSLNILPRETQNRLSLKREFKSFKSSWIFVSSFLPKVILFSFTISQTSL